MDASLISRLCVRSKFRAHLIIVIFYGSLCVVRKWTSELSPPMSEPVPFLGTFVSAHALNSPKLCDNSFFYSSVSSCTKRTEIYLNVEFFPLARCLLSFETFLIRSLPWFFIRQQSSTNVVIIHELDCFVICWHWTPQQSLLYMYLSRFTSACMCLDLNNCRIIIVKISQKTKRSHWTNRVGYSTEYQGRTKTKKGITSNKQKKAQQRNARQETKRTALTSNEQRFHCVQHFFL